MAVKPVTNSVVLPATVTKRVTHVIGGEGTVANTYTPLDVCLPYRVKLPFTPVRWRLKYRNYSCLSKTAGAASLHITGIWLGTPSFPSASPQRWQGQPAAAMTKVANADVTPSDASDWVGPWITNAGAIQAGVEFDVELGVNSGGANAAAFYDLKGHSFSGVGASAQAGLAAKTIGSFNGTIGDVRFEYEYPSPTTGAPPIVLGIGDSNMSGYSSDPEGNFYPHEVWLGQACLRQGAQWINLGVASSSPSDFATLTDWCYARADLATTVPDCAVIAQGTNALGVAFSTFQMQFLAIVSNLRSLGIPRIYVLTIPPHGYDLSVSINLTAELNRLAINAWLSALPVGIDGCFDTDQIVRTVGQTVVTQATLVSGAGGNPVTVASVGNGIGIGATVTGSAGIAAGTIVTGVASTALTLNNNPTASGAATLTFVNPSPLADPALMTTPPHFTLRGHQRHADIVRFPRVP